MNDNCEICRRIQLIKDGKNPYFVAELSTGYVVIGDNQHFKGYTLFLCKQHETELHFLPRTFKDQFLREMSLVAEAVYTAFHAEKMNYELLGNGDTHVHWHLFPRREGDTPNPGPVWWLDRNIMFSNDNRPTLDELETMKQTLKNELNKVLTADAQNE